MHDCLGRHISVNYGVNMGRSAMSGKQNPSSALACLVESGERACAPKFVKDVILVRHQALRMLEALLIRCQSGCARLIVITVDSAFFTWEMGSVTGEGDEIRSGSRSLALAALYRGFRAQRMSVRTGRILSVIIRRVEPRVPLVGTRGSVSGIQGTTNECAARTNPLSDNLSRRASINPDCRAVRRS